MNYRNWTVAELLDMEGSGVLASVMGQRCCSNRRGKKGAAERGAHLGSGAPQERGAGELWMAALTR